MTSLTMHARWKMFGAALENFIDAVLFEIRRLF